MGEWGGLQNWVQTGVRRLGLDAAPRWLCVALSSMLGLSVLLACQNGSASQKQGEKMSMVLNMPILHKRDVLHKCTRFWCLVMSSVPNYRGLHIILFKRRTSFPAQAPSTQGVSGRWAVPRPRVVGRKGFWVQAASSAQKQAFLARSVFLRREGEESGGDVWGEATLWLSDLRRLPRLLAEPGSARFTQGSYIL